MITVALAAVRVAALAQAALSAAISWSRFTHPLLVVATFGVVVAASSALVTVGLRRGSVGPLWLVAVDIGCTLGALVAVDGLIDHTANPVTDNVLYPYSAVALAVAGFARVRPRWTCTAAAAATLVYVASTAARFGFRTDLLENAATYWGYALVSLALARWFRRMSHWLDQARLTAVVRERELERADRERERLATGRVLHDHILQTMESLSRERQLDGRLRREIARESAWLRALIHNELDADPPGLVAALQDVVLAQAESGLQVELNTAGATSHAVPPGVIDALSGAVTEALTNVRKHAGCGRCVVRAEVRRERVTVTVVDHGRGFERDDVKPSIGITQSIIARVLEAGGSARISSTPGAGTRVELEVPLQPATADGASRLI